MSAHSHSASSPSLLAAKSSLLVRCRAPHLRPTRTTSTLTCFASCAWVHLGLSLTARLEQHFIIPARTSLGSRDSSHADTNLSELMAFQDGHEMLSLTVCVCACQGKGKEHNWAVGLELPVPTYCQAPTLSLPAERLDLALGQAPGEGIIVFLANGSRPWSLGTIAMCTEYARFEAVDNLELLELPKL